MRAWLIVGILLLGINGAISEHGRYAQKHQEIANQAPPSPPPSPATQNVLPAQARTDDKETDSNQNQSKLNKWWSWLYLRRAWFWPPVWSNWALAIAAILGICVALNTLRAIQRQGIIMIQQSRIMQRQARTMERQTIATEISATAARNSADALIASERGWLNADLVREASKFGGHWYKTEPYRVALTDEEIMDGLYYRYQLRITNIGRTPVQIIGLEHRYTCLEKNISELTPGVADEVLAINDERTLSGGETANIGFLKIDEQMASHRDEINTLERTAVFHGWVKYLALIDPSEESFADYCYVYSPSQEVLVRRDQYNPNRHGKKQQHPNA